MASRFHLFGVVLARPFFPHFSPMDSKAVQRSALCRSRRELSNDYLLAKFGFDTAENELCKVCPTLSVAEPRISLQSWRRAQEELVYAVSVKAPSLGRRTSRILTSAHQHD